MFVPAKQEEKKITWNTYPKPKHTAQGKTTAMRVAARVAVGGEERQNAKFPKEMDLMEELMRRAATYCPGANGGDRNECYWKLRGAWPGYPDDYSSSTS